jgi:hypothetical protein
MEKTYSNFDFSKFDNSKVLVFVTGPGYLEYPWALETALRLRDVGARVTLVDIALLAESYAMRLYLHRFQLPVFSRRLLRLIFLQRANRIENIAFRIAETNKLKYLRFQRRRVWRKPIRQKRPIHLKEYGTLMWGSVPAKQIMRTVVSNRLRELVDDDTLIPPRLEAQIRRPILQATAILDALLTDENDSPAAIFVSNGRQPVQAAISLRARRRNIETILYESAGGYIFPKSLHKRIDYFESSPHDISEMRQKISFLRDLSKAEVSGFAYWTKEQILKRQEIPFKLDYLPKVSQRSDLLSTRGKTYVFFSSSEWELSALVLEPIQGKSLAGVFSSQYEAIRGLRSIMSLDDNLIIRLHPSDPGKRSQAEPFWNEFSADSQIKIIGPNDSVDSYWLADKATLNFVWASFLGVELILRNIPVCVLGPSTYSHLIPESTATTLDELESWIQQPVFSNADNLLPYFAYLAKGGFPILYSKTGDNNEVVICGQQTDLPRRFPFTIPQNLLRAIS